MQPPGAAPFHISPAEGTFVKFALARTCLLWEAVKSDAICYYSGFDNLWAHSSALHPRIVYLQSPPGRRPLVNTDGGDGGVLLLLLPHFPKCPFPVAPPPQMDSVVVNHPRNRANIWTSGINPVASVSR